MNTFLKLYLTVALLISASTAFGAVAQGKFSVTALNGIHVYDGAQHLDSGLTLGLRAGYNVTENIGVEGLYNYVAPSDSSRLSLTNITLHRIGGQALYHFSPGNEFVPYLAAGYTVMNFSGSGVNSTGSSAIEYGVGAKYFLVDDIALRGDLRHIITGYSSKTYNNAELSAGVYFQFGGPAASKKSSASPEKTVAVTPPPDADQDGIADHLDQCPNTPAGVSVDGSGCPVDSDRDGIADYLDKCPNTPRGAAADGSGCPVDIDRDGVADYLDKCPATPAGVAADSSGCPVDSDRDGIADYLDKCQNTPAGVAADRSGCPVDADGDGIADHLDKCPDTPGGVAVDEKGCPVDTDRDGIADYLDKCPGTPAGAAVDTKGCPIESAKAFCDKPAVIAISFDVGKADINPRYYEEVDKLGRFLKEFPNAKGTIHGYTDADGSPEINRTLSQTRTESVRNYIVSKFRIDSNRIIAKGHGPANPVAPNNTEAGKAKNRRIEAVFSCE